MRMMAAAICALLMMVSGCTTAQGPGAAATGTSAAAFRQTSDAALQTPAEDYRVSAEDVLDVTVFRVPDLSKTVKVSASGQIGLPLIGAVPVSGKTVAEVEGEIKRRLAGQYMQDPQVTVLVQEAVSQRITLEGEVAKPGIYPTSGRTTLLQAIALAGGMSDLADERGVVVFRTIEGKRHAAVFNYASIRDGRDEDPIVLGGDIVTVDRSGVKSSMHELRRSIGVLGFFLPMI